MAANLPAVKDPFAKPASPFPGRASSTRTNLLNKPPTPVTDTGGPKQVNVKPSQINGKPPAPTPAPTPVAAPAQPVADPTTNAFNGIAPPGLTPDQMATFNKAWNSYQGALNTDNSNLAQAPINYANTVANDKAAFVQNSETAQAAAASRGLFNSSIKDGAMNDIAATQANNDFVAAGQLSSLTKSINADITTLNSNWGATAIGAVGDAVINGQNVPPTLTPAPTPVAGPAATVDTSLTNAGAAAAPGVKLGAGAKGAGNASNKSVAQQKVGAGLLGAGGNTGGGTTGAKQQKYGALS